MSNVIVIGAGAAGMMAAIAAAGNGHQVTVLEKNEKAGKKIYITGKGRCNITNACDVEELFNNVVTNKKFLYSAFYGFTNDDVVAMLNTAGLATKVERGNRVFPVSDRAGDVIAALVRIMKKLGVKLEYDTTVTEIITGTLDKTDGTADAADGGKCGAAAGAIATTVTGVRCAYGKIGRASCRERV